MAICNALNAGITKSCENNAGGIKQLFVADHSTLQGYTLTDSNITSLEYTLTTGSTLYVDVFNDTLDYILVDGDVTNQVVVGQGLSYQYNTSPNLYQDAKVTSLVLDGSDTRIYVDTEVSLFIQLTGMTVNLTPNFHEAEFNRGTSSYNEVINVNLQNGTSYITQTVVLNLARRQKEKSLFIDKLIAGQKDLLITLVDSNNIAWMFGLKHGATVSSVEGGSGVAKGDANGYVITFTAEEPIQAPEVDATIIGSSIFE